MLPKAYRLPAPDIRRVMRSGIRIQNDQVQFIYLPGTPIKSGQANSRFAFIVSTKIDKRATRRNRMRRLLSESVRLLLPALRRPVDGVFIVKKPLSDTQKEVSTLVSQLFLRAGI